MIIRLSGGRQIPVDAKVPFAAWLEALDCTDERRRGALMAAHARALRGHVDALAAKAYWRHFQPAPEFVVLFVPGEPLLDAALAVDPGLSDHAFARNVVIATPTSLIALLRTVAFTWRQERLSASAARGARARPRTARPAGHAGRPPEQRSAPAWSGPSSRTTSTVRSMESRVLVTARRFADLGVTGEELRRPGAGRHRCPGGRRRPSSTTIRPTRRRSCRCAVPPDGPGTLPLTGDHEYRDPRSRPPTPRSCPSVRGWPSWAVILLALGLTLAGTAIDGLTTGVLAWGLRIGFYLGVLWRRAAGAARLDLHRHGAAAAGAGGRHRGRRHAVHQRRWAVRHGLRLIDTFPTMAIGTAAAVLIGLIRILAQPLRADRTVALRRPHS